MKDLFVLTADADMQAVLRSVLRRHEEIGLRPIEFEVDRHTMRDSGMIASGPDLVRPRRGKYRKVLLVWDHLGSGCEGKFTAEESARRVEERLVLVSWRDHASAIVIDPELEDWLWQDPASIGAHLGISPATLRKWLTEQQKSASDLLSPRSKMDLEERLRHLFVDKCRRTVSPRDFERIAEQADLAAWEKSKSFQRLMTILRGWFPLAG